MQTLKSWYPQLPNPQTPHFAAHRVPQICGFVSKSFNVTTSVAAHVVLPLRQRLEFYLKLTTSSLGQKVATP